MLWSIRWWKKFCKNNFNFLEFRWSNRLPDKKLKNKIYFWLRMYLIYWMEVALTFNLIQYSTENTAQQKIFNPKIHFCTFSICEPHFERHYFPVDTVNNNIPNFSTGNFVSQWNSPLCGVGHKQFVFFFLTIFSTNFSFAQFQILNDFFCVSEMETRPWKQFLFRSGDLHFITLLLIFLYHH